MKFEVDKAYCIRFWDHCKGSKKLMDTRTLGIVIKDSIDSVTLTSWDVIGDDESRDDNHELLCIAKATITKKRKIPDRYAV